MTAAIARVRIRVLKVSGRPDAVKIKKASAKREEIKTIKPVREAVSFGVNFAAPKMAA